MELKLYTNKSDKRVVNKYLTDLITLNGTLRENCSITDPIITVENINNSIAAVCNYAKIAEFGRYYFVNDIVFTGKLYEIHMHVDVLMSFKTEFKQLHAIVGRQEETFNLYLQDGLFKTFEPQDIEIIPFTSGFDTFQYIFSVSG